MTGAPTVWVVSELYYPEETSTGYFLTGIAEGIARHYRTGVICARPTYAARSLNPPRFEKRNGVAIFRCRSTRLNPTILPFRVLNLVTISWSVFFNVLQRVRHGDKVIVVTNPPILPALVRIGCRVRKASSILLVHDVYPEVLSAAGILRKGTPWYSMLDRLFALVYHGFHQIVVLGRDMQKLVARKCGKECAPKVIPNWGELQAIAVADSANSFRQKLGLEGKFIVQYAGNLGRTHPVEMLIDAVRDLQTEPDIHFLFIGSGSAARQVAAEVGKLPNATFLAPVARVQLPLALAACDVAIVALRQGMKGVSVPSRIYNILASERPIVAVGEPDSELDLIVRENAVGWVVRPGDVDELVRTIKSARLDRAKLREMGARAGIAAEQFSRERAVAQWLELIQSLPS